MPDFLRAARRLRAVHGRGAVYRSLVPLLVVSLASITGAQDSIPARLSLGDAVRLAASRNASVKTARARTDQAEARVRERRADLLPSLSAAAIQSGRTQNTATFGFDFRGPTGEALFDPRGEILGPVNTLDVRARVSQSLLDMSAAERVRSARASADASGAEADVAAEQAAGDAAVAYLRTLRADAQVAARRADSTLAAELLRIAQDQVAAGVGIALDVTRARAQAAQIRAQLIAVKNDRDRAILELARALDLSADVPLALSDSLAGLPMESDPRSDATTAPAVSGRPELKVLDRRIASAARAEKAVRLERLPTVSAFADNGPIARNGRSFLDTYTWGVQLSLPIFDGFRREARVEEQAALRHEYDVRRHDLERQFTLDVRGAQIDLASAREQLDAARERLALADQELTQARDRFSAGVAGNADVVTASLGLNAARTLVIDALSSYHAARISLARAQGTVRSFR